MKNVLILLVLCIAISCHINQSSPEPETSDLITQLLTERVASYISVDDDIVLRFRDQVQLNTSTASELITFSPTIKGVFKWVDDRTLLFDPASMLPYDQAYTMSLDVKGFFSEMNTEKGTMKVNFQTKPLKVNFHDLTHKISAGEMDISIEILGSIQSNQYAESEAIESMLDLGIPKSQYEIEWTHVNNATLHEFTIIGIKQESEPREIKITWNGKNLDKGFKGSKTIFIGSEDQLVIQDVILHQSPSRRIVVFFSQPLDQEQNLNGLVKIEQNKDRPKTLIDGNELTIYTEGQLSGIIDLSISKNIKSFKGKKLQKDFSERLNIEPEKPKLRLTGNGVIVPSGKEITFPFEAINLDTVDLEIFKIYDHNVLQFLQDNSLSGNYNLEQVGKIIFKDKVAINDDLSQRNSWRSIGLELENYLGKDAAAIYQVRLGFRPSYSKYDCPEAVIAYEPPSEGSSIMDYRYYDYYGWDDPCSASYYTPDKFVSRNVLISKIGAIIKKDADNTYHVRVSDINDGSALPATNVSFYNFQRVLLGEAETGANGDARIITSEKASFAILRHMDSYAYLNLTDAHSKSVTDFNTQGKKSQSGIDAFIYTDRGVYRPGDSIHMHVIVEDGDTDLPTDHPLTLTVADGQGQVKFTSSTTEHIDQVYSFLIPTGSNDGTGLWRANVQVGAVSFSKSINVQTVKPNRLRINLTMDDRINYQENSSRQIKIISSWLHGAPASNLRARIDAQWYDMAAEFSDYSDYNFSDPARKIVSGQMTLYDEKLDDSGMSIFELKLDKNAHYPAMLRASLTNRVFEKGGDFSETYGTMTVSPYSSYVGVSLPKDRWGSRTVKIGDPAIASVIVLNEDGTPAGKRELSIGVYDIKWQWWYYRSQQSQLYELNSDQHSQAVIKKQIMSNANGVARIPIDTEELEYGRKLIRVCDLESGHCTGQFFYASGWRSAISAEERNNLSRLTFTSNKEMYQSGEEVTLSIPSEKGSRILISLEGEDRVISQDWIEGEVLSTEYKFRSNKSMSPNIYAHVTLLQPYEQLSNDLPIRMYGVIPIKINDPESVLSPKLKLPEKIEPLEEFSIDISEENGRPMTYTIAIVDEGLLDLTNFKTPDPHSHFYAKRSLGVKTWDLYDDVLYGLERASDKIISVGGDGETEVTTGDKKAIRFRPVVLSSGPHRLTSNGSNQHKFDMPNYIGSVRVMVVGRDQNAFGNSFNAIPVKSPLMVLPTLPRVISQGEQIKIPVSVFAMEDDIKNVKVSLVMTDNISSANSSKQLVFRQEGELVTSFDARVGNEPGIAKINVIAESAKYKSSQQIKIEIRNPNPVTTESNNKVLQPGEHWNSNYDLFGVSGTNKGVIELSQIPTLKIADRIDFLVNYPYGCLEQTTSSTFVQLYLNELTDYISDDHIDRNIKAGIKRIIKMQHSSGGFRYWPSPGSSINEWSSSYAGHFLMEAKQKDYYVPSDVLNKWAGDQKSRASRFRPHDRSHQYIRNQELIIQAYRLYTLSLYGIPNLSAMNLLRETADLPATGRYLLAASYAISSKSNLALNLIEGLHPDIKTYRDRGMTYGSEVRDMALIAQALSYLDRNVQSLEIIKKIADKLNSNRWYSTQSIAFGLMAVGRLSEDYQKSNIQASIKMGQEIHQDISYDKPVFTVEYNPDEAKERSFEIVNKSDKVLFASFQLSGQRPAAEMLSKPAVRENVSIEVKYKNLDGSRIDVSNLKQGTDFIAEVEITNLNTLGTTLEELALTQIIPSGWEVRSGRLNEVDGFDQDSYEYRDIRDDRVHTFFDLNDKKNFVLMLHATYEGEFFLPPVQVEAMYDKNVQASTRGLKTRVIKDPNTR